MKYSFIIPNTPLNQNLFWLPVKTKTKKEKKNKKVAKIITIPKYDTCD